MIHNCALIDADVLCYVVGSVASSMDEAYTLLLGRINTLVGLTPHKNYLLFISCTTEDGFRRQEIAKYYKGNRKSASRPGYYKECRQILQEMGAIMLPRLEADDAIAIYATMPQHKRSTVVSADKDFYSTPCNFLHVNFNRRQTNLSTVTEEIALYNHMIQTLMGDAADGYKGCPGIGEKRSANIIAMDDSFEDMWTKVVGTYVSKGYDEKLAIENARLAYLLRHGDYNIKTGEVKLWHPKNR